MELNEEFDRLGVALGEVTPEASVFTRRGIVVVGSHRSGTSALARVLNLVGCDLPKHVMPPLEGSNELGFWEPETVVQAHEAFLADIGSSWDDVAPLPEGAFVSTSAVQLRQQLSLLLQDEYGSSPLFVVKDPRVSRLLPLWFSVLAELRVAPATVISVRNPLEVAASLKARDGFTTTKSLLLWLRHTLEAEQHSRGRPRSIVMYDELLRDWPGMLDRVGEDLRLSWPGASHRATVEIENFLSVQQRHHVFDWTDLEGRPDVVSWVKDVYFALRASDPVSVLDDVHEQLARADTAFGPIFEEARLELAASRAQTLEAASARNSLAAEAEARSAALSDQGAEIQRLRDEVERLTAAIAAADESATASRVEVDLLRAQRDGFAREVEILAGEVERLAGLAEAAQSRAAAAELESGRARGDLHVARGEVARLTADVAESAARISALETEATADRDSSLGALEAARAEIRQLHEQVAAARARLQAAEAKGAAESEEIQSRLEEARSELAEAGEQARTADEAAAAAQSERDAAVWEVEILRAEVARLTDAAALAESVEARFRDEQETLRTELSAARAEVKRLTDRARDAQAAADRLEYELDAIKSAAAQSTSETNALVELADVEVSALRAERERLQAQLANALEEHDELLILVGRLEAAAESASFALDDRARVAETAAAESAAREAELDADRERLLRQLEDARSELDGKRHETDEARSELGTLRAEAESERAGLSAELQSARSELKRLETRSGELEAALETERSVARALQLMTTRRGRRRRSLAQLSTWLVRPTPRRLGYLRRYVFLRWSGEFDVKSYLLRNPDVLEAGLNPLMHYVEYGRPEGRQPFVGAQHPAALTSGERDPGLIGSGDGAMPESDSEEAVSAAPPIADETNDHAIQFDPPATEAGSAPTILTVELREALEGEFDREYYLGAHEDIERSGMDPLEHYFYTGWREDRDPSARFSTSYYLSSNPDVAEEDINPLVHYVVTGRQEGRRPYPPTGFKRQALTTLRSIDEEVDHWQRGLVAPVAPISGDSLTKRLVACVGERRHVVVSCSHDNYTTSVGGIQLAIALEQKAFVERDCAYIHLHPTRPLPILSRVRTPDALTLAVICDGEEIGVAPADAVIDSLVAIGSDQGLDFGFVVHALHGHSPEVIAEMHGRLAPRWSWLWLHDYFGICPSATLLRNRIEPCGAPEPDSPGCTICVFGEERLLHLPRFRALLEAVPFNLVAPSEFMADRWKTYFGDGELSIKVHENGVFAPRENRRSSESAGLTADGPVRVAFLGVPAVHKGWGVFLELLRRATALGNYRFYHFGDGRYRAPDIERREVNVLETGPLGTIIALREEAIDFAVIWSIWEESFSYTAHEALSGGAAILTNEDSGNIARVVKESGQGIVFPDEEKLFAAFKDGSLLEMARDRRGNGTTPADLVHSRMTADFASFDD